MVYGQCMTTVLISAAVLAGLVLSGIAEHELFHRLERASARRHFED